MREIDSPTPSLPAVEPSAPFTVPLMSFGAMVRLLRTQEGLSLAEFAKRMRLHQSTPGRIESSLQLPTPENVAKIIPALGLDPSGFEVGLLMKQYEEELARRKVAREGISPDEQLRSGGVVNFSSVARELGVSPKAISRRYHSLRQEDPSLPPNIKDPETRAAKIEKIKDLCKEGVKSHAEIAARSGTTEGFASKRLTELMDANETPRLRKKKRTKHELEALDATIEPLYNQGLSYQEIADRTGENLFSVKDSINKRLRSKKRDKNRIRSKRRVPEAIG